MDCQILESKIRALILSNEFDDTEDAENNDMHINSTLSSSEILHKTKLKEAIQQWEKERNDRTFSRSCLFCHSFFISNRSELLCHMREQHNFSLGAPDNIVYIDEFLNTLEDMLKILKCFYCEKIFKDYPTLKEHMRKKQHKKINPKNKSFDKFYMINYLDQNKSWEEIKEEVDSSGTEDDENELEMMECSEEGTLFTCLFCKRNFVDFDNTLIHMRDYHNYDFQYLKQKYNLDIYHQIKLVNYIRKKVLDKECIFCDHSFSNPNDLLRHMTDTGHISLLPEESKWTQPMFYFSCFENDNFLCALQDDDVNLSNQNEPTVYAEDIKPPINTFLCDERLRETLI